MTTRHTDTHWVFILDDGSKCSVGKQLAEEDALELALNPIPHTPVPSETELIKLRLAALETSVTELNSLRV